MTGRPAETWRKFQFTTAPAWAYLFLILVCIGIGLLLIFIVMFAVSRRAGGYLPLTHESSSHVGRASTIGLSMFLLVAVLWAAGIAIGVVAGSDSPAASSAAGVSFVLGLLALVAATAYWLLVKPRFGPQGTVMATQPGQWDNLVEIRHVHPAFVAAVQHHQHMRAAQAMPPPPPPPPPSPLLPT